MLHKTSDPVTCNPPLRSILNRPKSLTVPAFSNVTDLISRGLGIGIGGVAGSEAAYEDRLQRKVS